MDAIIKTYGKNELADLYEIDLKTLHSWLDFEDVKNELLNFGYNKFQRQFTAKQVEIIFSHLAPPEAPLEQKGKNFKKIPFKTYSKGQLAKFYGWSVETFMRYLYRVVPEAYHKELFQVNYSNSEKITDTSKRIFSVRQVKIVFFWLGHPLKMIKVTEKSNI